MGGEIEKCSNCGSVLDTRIEDFLVELNHNVENVPLHIDCICDSNARLLGDESRVLLVCPKCTNAVRRILKDERKIFTQLE